MMPFAVRPTGIRVLLSFDQGTAPLGLLTGAVMLTVNRNRGRNGTLGNCP